jgi:predicted phosphoribosyltransferase
MFLNDALVGAMNVDSAYIEEEKEIQLEDMARRGGIFRSIYPKIPLEGREVIITDDGIATGATMQAAFWTAHQEKAAWIVGAFPVAHPRTLERLREDTDDLVCLKAPMFFDAVARFYASFGQVSDEDVLHILRQESERKSKGPKSCILH